MIVILQDIRSLQNVGSIFRTADAAGIKKIYLAGFTPGPLDVFGKFKPQFVKVSLGAEKTVVWEKAPNAGKLIEKLKKQGNQILAVEQNKKSLPYFKLKLSPADSEKTVLIFGNEVAGIPPAILRNCDKILEIPMRGKKESLNVAVAFGIAVFHFQFPHA